MLCYGSALLPGEPYATEEADKARSWGKLVHSWKETGEIARGTGQPGALLQRAIECSAISRETLWPVTGRHEVSLALRIDGTRDVVTSDKALTGLLGDNWVTGTADYWGYLFEHELWLDDLKTGKIYPDPETGINRFPQDVESPQLRFYALALAKLIDYRGPAHVSLTHWPRLPVANRNALPERLWATFTEEEQESFYVSLESMYNSYAKAKRDSLPELTPGDHCRFCPSRNWCLVAKTDFPTYSRS